MRMGWEWDGGEHRDGDWMEMGMGMGAGHRAPTWPSPSHALSLGSTHSFPPVFPLVFLGCRELSAMHSETQRETKNFLMKKCPSVASSFSMGVCRWPPGYCRNIGGCSATAGPGVITQRLCSSSGQFYSENRGTPAQWFPQHCHTPWGQQICTDLFASSEEEQNSFPPHTLNLSWRSAITAVKPGRAMAGSRAYF